MSLTRSLLNDFRPLFRMIEDPFFSSPSVFPRYARSDAWQPFAALQRQAAVEVTEDGNDVVVHAEMPGVKKENLDVHLSNDGQSLTIEGHVHRISQASATPAADSANQTDRQLCFHCRRRGLLTRRSQVVGLELRRSVDLGAVGVPVVVHAHALAS
ncbi:hypothetical protein RhiXN_09316 [Rhizoctonia solani]|uniref:SHSP domain-containing protein n=1 Tax=Rhizoctonia solani TaxID=456999 RepID=A0A8H8NUL3_9AGAM|nr:uncharacterized protein RhiXN_09316 [Rhizoctonia solani]QRW20341.1 hypothetical protein RhiXN_09316 [Rhizoctonia solani]